MLCRDGGKKPGDRGIIFRQTLKGYGSPKKNELTDENQVPLGRLRKTSSKDRKEKERRKEPGGFGKKKIFHQYNIIQTPVFWKR